MTAISLITLRQTPQACKLEAYSEMCNGRGKRLMNSHPLSEKTSNVMNLFVVTMREMNERNGHPKRWTLKEVYDAAYAKWGDILLNETSYISANQRSDVPARVMIKG